MKDNIAATGVDDVSRTANENDPGYQKDFWIMAPLQGPSLGNGAAYENQTHISIGLDEFEKGEMACANATPDSDPAAADVSQDIELDGAFHDILWQGDGNGIDSEETVNLKIDGGTKELPLPIKVKSMKYRKVKLKIYRTLKKKADGSVVAMDEGIVPTKAELENYLNPLFAYQLNTWFEVEFAANTQEVDWGEDFT